MDEGSFDEVLQSLYSAASGKQSWGRAMNLVAEAFDAWAVQLIGMNKANGSVLFSHDGGKASPESALDYIREYHQHNPRIRPTLALGAEEWIHDHELFDEEFVANNSFYRDFLIPYGGRYLSGTKIVDNDERLVIFGAMRGCGTQPFTLSEREYLDRLKRHLVVALRIQTHLRVAHSDVQAGAALLNQFDRPMILIDAERTICFRNTAGARMLSDGDYILERNGVLHCCDRGSDRELSLVLHELRLLEGLHHVQTPPDRRFLRTRAADATPIGIYLVAMRPAATMETFGHEPRALVFFHDPRSSPGLDPLIVAETFDLTPAESRVAVALAAGYGIADIAKRHQVAVVTIRTQLKAVFAKTNTARQAELVRMLVAMPALSLSLQ